MTHAKSRVMLVGPWKWTTGGVTTFMNNVAGSHLTDTHDFLRYNIARPPKRNVADNYGYGAILRGGIGRMVLGVLITLFHVLWFPFALLLERPDIVQVQSSDFQVFWEASLYVRMARGLRFPVLMRLGGAFDHFYAVSSPGARARIRRVLLWPDILIVQSNYWRDTVEALGRRRGIVVVANSVPDSLAGLSRLPNESVPICLFAAGSEPLRKGFAEVLDAMRIARDSKVRVQFHIVAAGEETRRRVSEAGFADDAIVEGLLTRSRMLDAMRAADIFLLPSRGEGFPNALVEAMAFGLAPVVTPVGAIPEIVAETGAIVVPVRNGAALAGAIARLAADAELRAEIGASVRRVVKGRYVHSVALAPLGEAWCSALAAAHNAGKI